LQLLFIRWLLKAHSEIPHAVTSDRHAFTLPLGSALLTCVARDTDMGETKNVSLAVLRVEMLGVKVLEKTTVVCLPGRAAHT